MFMFAKISPTFLRIYGKQVISILYYMVYMKDRSMQMYMVFVK